MVLDSDGDKAKQKKAPRYKCPKCGYSIPSFRYNRWDKDEYCPICDLVQLKEFKPEA